MEKQVAHLNSLQEISSTLNSKLNLEDVLTSILDEAIRVIGAERGCLYLTDAATGELELRLSRRLRPSDLNGEPFQLSRTVIDRVWCDGKPVLTANAAVDPELGKADSVIKYTLRSILCVPLGLQGKQIGVLYLDNRLKVGQFQEDDLSLAVAIADQAAIALHNANLYQLAQRELAEHERAEKAIRRRNRELSLLNRVGHEFSSSLDLDQVLSTVLERVRHLLDVTACSVWLLDPETDELICKQATGPHSAIVRGWRLASGQGIVGWAAYNGKSLIVPDAHADERHYEEVDHKTGLNIRSILTVPLRVKGDVTGVIQVVDIESDRFSPADLGLIEALASPAAIAIENARLYAQIRQLTIEQERNRLARDLHDTVTQSLYGVGLAAQTALRLIDKTDTDSQIRSPIEYIQAIAQTALAQMREQLNDLHPTTLVNRGLVGALAQHCDVLRERYSLAVQFVADHEPPLSVSNRETLYYIAREALWNVVKHACAACIDVSLTGEAECVTLSVVDDGDGFDPSIARRKQTMGLRNMQERTRQMAGTFEVESQPGHGTRITVRIPSYQRKTE
jgi:signal transduction histidine kinase